MFISLTHSPLKFDITFLHRLRWLVGAHLKGNADGRHHSEDVRFTYTD